MKYIQRKDGKQLETVDQFETSKEAREMLKEYQISDRYASYYISTRPCKDWRGQEMNVQKLMLLLDVDMLANNKLTLSSLPSVTFEQDDEYRTKELNVLDVK